jgi:hypothetical protein
MLSEGVAMKAGKELGEIYPKQSYYNNRHTCNCPGAVDTWILFPEHMALVEISDVNQPGCERPEFFRVPTPVIAPGEFTPPAAEDKAECQ